MNITRPFTIVGLFLCVALFGMAPAMATVRPNILLIVGEDHGCELSCYGDPVIKTPNIDRLASEGVLFENGYVTQSVCSPSRSTIFTGLYPHQNGQLGLATHQYGWFKKWPTTYSLLKQAGYRTGLIGKTHVIPADAVESFVDFRFQPSANFSKKKVADYAVKAGEFFRAGDEPFFMTVNYPDAHWPLQGQVDGLPKTQVDPETVQVLPYIGHETPRMREVVRNYYDCMLRLDACVGQLLKQLDDSGKAANTLVVFIGDHGAQMARGKVTVYEGGMRVPYIVRWPGVSKPKLRSKALVSTIDLLPTFVDAAGTQAPLGLPGKSLRSLFGGMGDEEFREYLACERNCDAARHTFPQRTIRDARYKLIHSPVRDREDPAARYYRVHGASHWSGCLTDEELTGASEQTKAGYARWLNPPEVQLYDLKTDPHEWNDLSGDPQHSATKQRLLGALRQWQTDTRDPLADAEKLRMLLEENDTVFKAGRRSPKDGWRYLKYLAPNTDRVVFQQRDIPAGVPREGHAQDATKYGYRIPSLLVTQKGSILAFSERRLGLHDHAQNDIVLRRSTDGGRTWTGEIVAYEDGMNSINDPLTVQLENGRILLMFARFPYGRHTLDSGWIKMANLGYDDPKANVLTFICHSDDDGQTWSRPADISRQVRPPHLVNANTPGAMIQLARGPHKGRVVTGLWGTLPIKKDGQRSREWQIVVAYSDDNGNTWKRTEPLIDETGVGFPNECQVAEAANGEIVLISRNQGGDRFRKKAISHDGGATWGPIGIDRGLPSVACMGSVIKGPVKEDGTWDLWASFPSNTGRKDGQIAVSKDDGKTWRIAKIVHGPFAYSALQVSPDGLSLLCLYESDNYKTQTLIAIPFKDIAEPITRAEVRPNVLFIAIDDLRPALGCYGDKMAKTPNIDRLASRGTVFNRAYCQQAVCSPSRLSLLTGRRPDTIRVWDLATHFRDAIPDVVTLPQHFKNHGYHTLSLGKIYHGSGKPSKDPPSWSVDPQYDRIGAPEVRYALPENLQGSGLKRSATEAADVADNAYLDGIVCDAAVAALAELQARQQPFFLAVGFRKPHLPFCAPQTYWDLWDRSNIPLPVFSEHPQGASELAVRSWKELEGYSDIPQDGQLSKDKVRKLRHGYYACVSYVDALVGRLLNELARCQLAEDTVIVLWGDHGYHLGEQGLWTKANNYELSTRVPLIISVPGQARAGAKTDGLVEFVDVYPTLADLCGLDAPAGVEGISLKPLIAEPDGAWKRAVFSQYPRAREGSRHRGHGDIMGYAVRTDRYRYVEWRDWNSKQVIARELYDHESDPDEMHNVAAHAGHAEIVEELARTLASGWKSARTEERRSKIPDTENARPRTSCGLRPQPRDDSRIASAFQVARRII